MATLKIIFTVLEALLALNLLIFVHELGHFLAARWRGMRVDRFAIWFGKPLWKKKIDGVEYALGWIPAGGYVALPQMASMEMIEGKSDNSDEPLPQASALDKIIVAFAGPLFSFLLAIAFAVIVWQVGKPEQAAGDTTTVGYVKEGGPAWNAGLRTGDEIVSIDGYKVNQFGSLAQDSITWRIVTSEGTNISITYLRDGKESTIYAVPEIAPTKWYERKSLRKIGISPARPAIIGSVAADSPAARAGLTTNDHVLAVNGEKMFSPEAVMALEDSLTNGSTEPMTFTVKREGNEFDCTLQAETPIKPTNAPPLFGIMAWIVNTNEALTYPRPLDQIVDSAGQIFATIETVASPKSDVGVQQLGGAVMIIRAYNSFFGSENGWRRVLWFSVILNVNLALLNMLPFPVLDGGHILLALIEAVRRRPVSARLLNYLQSACALLLIGFMLFIAFYDTGDWIRSARQDREDTVVFKARN